MNLNYDVYSTVFLDRIWHIFVDRLTGAISFIRRHFNHTKSCSIERYLPLEMTKEFTVKCVKQCPHLLDEISKKVVMKMVRGFPTWYDL